MIIREETCTSIPAERARTGIDQGEEERKGNYTKGGMGGRAAVNSKGID